MSGFWGRAGADDGAGAGDTGESAFTSFGVACNIVLAGTFELQIDCKAQELAGIRDAQGYVRCHSGSWVSEAELSDRNVALTKVVYTMEALGQPKKLPGFTVNVFRKLFFVVFFLDVAWWPDQAKQNKGRE